MLCCLRNAEKLWFSFSVFHPDGDMARIVAGVSHRRRVDPSVTDRGGDRAHPAFVQRIAVNWSGLQDLRFCEGPHRP